MNVLGFLVTLTLSMLVAPLVAGAQPAGKVPTIGFLIHNSATPTARHFEAFAQGLRELGYIEGQTIAIERRYAEGRLERLPALAAELATLPIDVFVVTINSVAKAVQQTTTQSPIVMTGGRRAGCLWTRPRVSRILGAPSRGWRSCPARRSMARIWSF